MKTTISLGKMNFQNPVFGASGCIGHGYEIEPYTDLGRFGALSMKTVTYDVRLGNKPPRVCEVDDGMMTSIGLQNPGVFAYIEEELPEIKRACRPDQIIISVGGNEVSDYVETAVKIAESCSADEIAAIEVNGACPNVTHGGGVMSSSPEKMYEVVNAVKKAVPFPVIGKMNTNFASFCDVAKAIEDAGADAVYLVSTPMGLKIDLLRRCPLIGNVKAPVSGPAVRPQAVLKTWEVYEAVKLPIIASGGIYTAEAAIENIMAGAAAVGIGSAQLINPNAAAEILDDMIVWCESNRVDSFEELIGCAH